MFFVLGYIAGILTALCILVVAVLFRAPLERRVRTITRQLDSVSPAKEKGAVFFPPSEEDERRQEILADNSRRGKSTKISELS